MPGSLHLPCSFCSLTHLFCGHLLSTYYCQAHRAQTAWAREPGAPDPGGILHAWPGCIPPRLYSQGPICEAEGRVISFCSSLGQAVRPCTRPREGSTGSVRGGPRTSVPRPLLPWKGVRV